MAGAAGNNKIKLLVLAEIFRRETDEKHPLSLAEITDRLSRAGIEAERKCLYNDMELLTRFGMTIEKSGTGKSTAYYLAEREFELPELKLLADAVACSKFITQKKSGQLIDKLTSLGSRYDAGELRRNVIVYDRIKNENEQIYYTVDAIQQAITEKKRLLFFYFDYDRRKRKSYHNGGALIELSPYALCWREESYYVVGYYPKRGVVTNFRVDKMERARMLDIARTEPPESFSLADYTKKRFGMFSGEDTRITLRVHNSLSGVIFDRFGRDIAISIDDDEHFIINQPVTVSPILFGWIFQFGDKIEILSPENVKEEFLRHLGVVREKYEVRGNG